MYSYFAENIKIIEQNHLGHFAYLPKTLGFDVHKMQNVTIINCGLHSSMFNIVYGRPENPSKIDDIKYIKESFNGQSFAWWVPPSIHTPAFTKALLGNGFVIEAIEHAMICDLSKAMSFVQTSVLLIKPVLDENVLQDFISLIDPYDPAARIFYEKVNNTLLQSQENFFIGYGENKPVTIGILFYSNGNAGIFSLITSEQARGKGYGTDMVRFLMKTAKANNCKFLTLSASSDSGYRIYERLGFHKVAEFECFEYKGKDI
jgi:ribosomal protein S18 acetylase RimI-like enzyme